MAITLTDNPESTVMVLFFQQVVTATMAQPAINCVPAVPVARVATAACATPLKDRVRAMTLLSVPRVS